MSEPTAHPGQPDMLTIICLTEGFVIQYQGKSLAVNTPDQSGKLVKKILADRKHAISLLPPRQIRGEYTQPVPQPTSADPVPEASPPVPSVSLDNSRQNLRQLVRRRVMNDPQVSTDSAFFMWAAKYCPGLDEDEIVDALDAAMQSQDPPEVPPGVRLVPGQEPEPQNPRTNGHLDASSDPQLHVLSPRDMVDDFVLDMETGQPLTPEELAQALGG